MTGGQHCWEPVGLVCSPEGREQEGKDSAVRDGRDGLGPRAACPDKGARSCLTQPRPQARYALGGIRQGFRAGLGTQMLPRLAPHPPIWTWRITINRDRGGRGPGSGAWEGRGEDCGGPMWGGARQHSLGPGPPPTPTLPSWPCLSRAGSGLGAGDGPGGGGAGAPWVYSGGFQITPRAWRGPRQQEQHTQSPRRAPHWSAVTSALCQQRPSGFMEQDGPARPRPAPHPQPTH